MVMQLSVPNGPQPSQNPPLVQWNPCKYYSIEQRPSKPGELYKPDNTPQVHTQTHTECMNFLTWLPPSGQQRELESVRSHEITETWFKCLIEWFYFLCLGQHPADESPGLPHPVSHPVPLRQCQQCLSRPGTITPHFPVPPARRTHSRYELRGKKTWVGVIFSWETNQVKRSKNMLC